MKQNYDEQFYQSIQKLKQDPNLARRTASAVLERAREDKPTAHNGIKFLLLAAAALVLVFLMGTNFSKNQEEITEATPQADDYEMEEYIPEDPDDFWQKTDNLILTTFGSR
jgi:hypothetical protein